VSELVQRFLAGDRRALSQALSAVENEKPEALGLLQAVRERRGRARVIGITGAAGTGKSTLISALLRVLRRRGLGVGVLAVDPSSPLSGGAVLGDRIRMAEHDLDSGVFVRSLASRGELGGLSRQAFRLVDVMDAFGFDVVLLETVGTGQSEVAVVEAAPTRLVVLAPGLGDEIQALKAGILEIADRFAVAKADLPDAERTAAVLRSLVPQPVHLVSARKGEGLDALADALLAEATPGRGDALARMRRLLATEVGRLAKTLAENAPDLAKLAEAVDRGERDLASAAREVMKNLARRRESPR
jgi:LAO/AO transport system kinase